MRFVQVFVETLPQVLPWLLRGAEVLSALLLCFLLVTRWKKLSYIFQRFVLRRAPFALDEVIQVIERMQGMRDLSQLYHNTLAAAVELVRAEGGSFLVRDEKHGFQVKAVCDLKPLGFCVENVASFFTFLTEYRSLVTKEALVHDPALALAKSSGLTYCLQFSAEICIPLAKDGELFGVLNLGRRKVGKYERETLHLLELLASQFSGMLQNAMLYESLARKNQHLAELSELKNQLVSNVSHELRSPLTAIIGLSELMTEGIDGPMNDEQLMHSRMIRQSGLRLLEIVNSMLDLSKFEANQMTLNVKKVDLRRLSQEVIDELSPHEGVEIHNGLVKESSGVFADETRIRQMLKHLFENAIKFTREGLIHLSAEKIGDMLKVTIADTGIGIAESQRQSIFEIFQQADGRKNREYKGLGLGLTVSRQIVELHGGRMWCESQAGKGSRFYFTLPLKPTGFREPKALHQHLLAHARRSDASRQAS